MTKIETLSRTRVFGGEQIRFRHQSAACAGTMTCTVFLPPADGPVPALYWLSGLTCNDENFVIKAGAQRVAAELGIALVVPDTSPRDTGIAGEDDSYDLGSGAGFYVNATQAPWAAHYQMYDYVSEELVNRVREHFPLTDGAAISGHSMGGHGALVIGLNNPDKYASISAFAPICNPSDCPWGVKALTAYLGDDRDSWRRYDACAMLRDADGCPPIFIDQGSADEFLAEQLHTPRLIEAIKMYNRPAEVRMQEGYDHSYFFIASFIEDHLRFHAHALYGI